MTMDGAPHLLFPASASLCNSQMWHWLHIQVTLRKGLDGAAEVLLNSKEGMAKKGTCAPQRKLAMQQASQTEMSFV